MGPRQTLLLPEDPPAPRGLPPPQTFFTPWTLPPLEDTSAQQRHCGFCPLFVGRRFVGLRLFNWSQSRGAEVPLTPLPMSEHMAQHLVVRLPVALLVENWNIWSTCEFGGGGGVRPRLGWKEWEGPQGCSQQVNYRNWTPGSVLFL